ncbi:hypothetical protein D3C84_1109810 [compost metagenome]
MVLQGHAGDPWGDQQQRADHDEAFTSGTYQAHTVVDQRGGQGQGEGNQPHPTDGGEPGQRAVELAVAGIKPWETGQEPTAECLLANPQRRKCQGVRQRGFVSP